MSVDPGTKKGIRFDASSSPVIWICDNKTILINCALKEKKVNNQSCRLKNIGVCKALV